MFKMGMLINSEGLRILYIDLKLIKKIIKVFCRL